ncbi:alpha-D-ribose 1-methylphosphonate 5-triphosphate diphosphatase [Ralstonia insidiosa]|jgi:alpha-D-ribose 1-methylphosphonate 5-triphosphate diphosphatase|uniref:alpha-D-ribose 1-methylphosphonate 5-triphosphate diphosphatase n=1 Tax=Ralstonia TaxID=48736 RepID=UPI000664A0C3|nr:alpha-D-ribose 1-methylphosphonate 5-triphosphate diphosphatase [Ralstonia insidiosa]KMW46580.1 phosphonate metabolism protein PhnM [Ralstonia sp. MD27]MBX3771705.1 alpha-D-ribose 1-methylphosphonate 5-triphosphate diphosphatase [Ralstonia pickettii]NPA02497.1 alpha-D-ribose 1-methylphosphonate 5-triphosphate diphosphatase [Betaproteobacteria bacterium]MBA9855804.1 alpha-D-ribose 1-methylphosphonate 5-triphosphate diphosphatase [Ralstonia insidiosa]MBA9868747.1 alpha-D-ribose 1-methylphosph
MQSFSSSVGHLAGLVSRRTLLADGLVEAAVQFRDGRITACDANPARGMLDCGDLLVLPGIVDLHGDAFERAVMPRPGVAFPYDTALADVDGQLLANGITTEFHGVTYSWEGGLRGHAYALRMLDTLEAMRPHLGAEHLMHLRFELHHADGVADALAWMAAGRVHFLSFNDHLPMMRDKLGDARKLAQYADRAECDVDTFRTRLDTAAVNVHKLDEVLGVLARAAQQHGIRMASHDEPDVATRNTFHAQGCTVTEFPLTEEVARAARAHGGHIVFGAPNVVRGGSHNGAPNAAAMVAAGLGTVLASDYYYPALLAAPFKLAERGVAPLARAWDLVAANPAEAAGLTDRGRFAAGLRADAIVVDDRRPGLPRVVAAVVGGRLRHATGHLPLIA